MAKHCYYLIKRKVATLTRGEVIAKLRKEGFAASVGRVRQALMNGFVKPLPRKTARGAFNYKSQHIEQLREYLVRSSPGPRPLCAEKFPIKGSADRLHRLARKKQRLRDRGPSERALRQQRRRAADDAIQCLELIARQLASECVEGGIPSPSSWAEQ